MPFKIKAKLTLDVEYIVPEGWTITDGVRVAESCLEAIPKLAMERGLLTEGTNLKVESHYWGIKFEEDVPWVQQETSGSEK